MNPPQGAQLEDPVTVGKKGQLATKALADMIGNRLLLKNTQITNVTTVTQTGQGAETEKVLKALADAIGQKYLFYKEKQAQKGRSSSKKPSKTPSKESSSAPLKRSSGRRSK